MDHTATNPTPCSVVYENGDPCDRPARKGSNMCSGHQERRRRFGDPLVGGPLGVRRPKGTLCEIGRTDAWRDAPPCDGLHYSLGFCAKHYQRYITHGDPRALHIDTENDGKCSVPGCTRPYDANGLCHSHYTRAALHGGDPLGGIRSNNVQERLLRRCIEGPMPKRFYNPRTDRYDGMPPCPCRDWTHTRDHKYGVISVGNRNVRVHRLVYEQEVGPIPKGLHLDHLCCRTVCCEPRHLEPVTRAENTRRRWLVINEMVALYEDEWLETMDVSRVQSLVWPNGNT